MKSERPFAPAFGSGFVRASSASTFARPANVHHAFAPEQEELTRTLRAFTRKELAPRSRHWDTSGEFPWEAWWQMGELGLLGFRNPAEFGGNEIDLVSMGIAMEEIARGDFSATYGIQLAGLVGQILGQSGSAEIKLLAY